MKTLTTNSALRHGSTTIMTSRHRALLAFTLLLAAALPLPAQHLASETTLPNAPSFIESQANHESSPAHALANAPSFIESQANHESSPAHALANAPSFLQAQAAAQTATAPIKDTTAVISGIVSDVRGGLVPGATIKLEAKPDPKAPPAPTLTRELTSDAEGHFSFPDLPAGPYTVRIAASGLETFLSKTILLRPGEHFELPDIALPIASANTSVDVAANTSAVAEQELDLETKQRLIGILPSFYTSFIYNAAPLNTRQKFKLSLRSTTDPFVFASTAITAGIQQARDTFPGWSTDTAGYFKRYFAAYGDALLGRTIGSALYPALFHQDPRYFYMGPDNPVHTRILHAISEGLIARGDNGHLQPNYSHILGNATAGAISTVYHPASDSAGKLALDNGLIGIADGGVQGLLREFVFPHFIKHIPSYAKGKTAAIPEAPAAITPTPAAPAPTPPNPPPANPPPTNPTPPNPATANP